jgi:uncharacterized protein
VIAGAKRREIRLEGDQLKVKLLAKPIRGRANEELVDFLAETLRVKKREITIISGERDTRKVVSIPYDRAQLEKVLGTVEHT